MVNQKAYKSWVRNSFVNAFLAVIGSDKITTGKVQDRLLELFRAKNALIVQVDNQYWDVIKHDRRINNYPQFRWHFCDFPDRVRRAMETAVKLGLIDKQLKSTWTRNCQCQDLVQRTYEYFAKK
jgi:hypothetical protein